MKDLFCNTVEYKMALHEGDPQPTTIFSFQDIHIHTMFYFCVNLFPSLLANKANCKCSPYCCVCNNTSDNVFVHLLYPGYIHAVLCVDYRLGFTH